MKNSKLLSMLMITTIFVTPAAASVVKKPPVEDGGFFSSLFDIDNAIENMISSFSQLSIVSASKQLVQNAWTSKAVVPAKPQLTWEEKWKLIFERFPKAVELHVDDLESMLTILEEKMLKNPKLRTILESHWGRVMDFRVRLASASNEKEKISLILNFHKAVEDLVLFDPTPQTRELHAVLKAAMIERDLEAGGFLKKLSNLTPSSENLDAMQIVAEGYYKAVDPDDLFDLTKELDALKVGDNPKALEARWSFPSKGTWLLGLVVGSGLLQTVAATAAPQVRPQIANDAFSLQESFKEGFSGFMPVSFVPSQLLADATSILTFSNYQNVVQNGLGNPNGRNFAFNSVRGILNSQNMPTNCIGGDGCYFSVDTFGNGATPLSNTTREVYHFYNPGQGMLFQPHNGTTLNQTSYDIATVGSTGNFTSQFAPGTLTPYYYDQRDGSEIMVLSVVNPTNDLIVLSAMERGLDAGGAFYARLIAQGVATNETLQNKVDFASLPTTPVTSLKPTVANSLDNATFDQMNNLYSGYVDGPSGNNSRTIQQFAVDSGLLPPGLTDCLSRLSVDPILCVNYMGADHYMRLSTFHTESLYGLDSVSKSVVDGPTVRNAVVRQINGTATEEVTHTYSWNPSLGTPTNTVTASLGNVNGVKGALPSNTIEKFVEIYGNDLNSGAIVIHATQTPQGTTLEFKAVPGSDIVETEAPAPTMPPSTNPTPPSEPMPTPASPSAPMPTPTSQPEEPSTPEPKGLSTATKAGIGAGTGTVVIGSGITLGVFLYKRNHTEKNVQNDVEMGTVTGGPSERPETQLNFAKTTKGLSKARTTIKNRYQLIDTIDQEDAAHIQSKMAGVEFVFPDGAASMPLVLGNGNFGKVGVVYDTQQDQYLAVKIVRGNDKVAASLREGILQYAMHQQKIPGALPLLDYLHFEPSNSKSAITQLQQAVFGNSFVEMSDGTVRDMTAEELLIQITPWATFGNGETFQGRLNQIEDGKFKQTLINHATYSLMTTLSEMSDFGVSHLDLKAENTLFTWDGDVYVADYGCARIKDKMQGGLGDFRYFSPQRLKHVQNDVAARKTETKVKGHFSGKKNDAWALGMTILQWCIGEHPYAEVLKAFNGKVAVGMLTTWKDESFFTQALAGALDRVRGNELEVIINGLLNVDEDARLTVQLAKGYMERYNLVTDPAEVKPLFATFRKTLASTPDTMDDSLTYGEVPLFYSKAPETENYNATRATGPVLDVYLSQPDESEPAYVDFYNSQLVMYQKESKQNQAKLQHYVISGEGETIAYEQIDTQNPPVRNNGGKTEVATSSYVEFPPRKTTTYATYTEIDPE